MTDRDRLPFIHRTEIGTQSPIVQAVYALARKAHLDSGQKRGKGNLPYLVHPIMVYDLLKWFGEKDEITLACALLHDALEDGPEYKNDKDAMRQQLVAELTNRGVTDAEQIADVIHGICKELTNDKDMCEGKQIWQIEHAGRISPVACTVKLFDQMASILDNIMMPDDPGTKKGGKPWALKALAVVKAIAGERSQLNFHRDMFKVLFKYNMNILDADPSQAAILRQGFVWQTAVNEAQRINQLDSTPIPVTQRVLSRRCREAQVGVIQVGLDAQGKIVEYACLCNPTAGKDEARNNVAIGLMGALEASSTSLRVTTGAKQVLGDRLVRVNKVKPPIDARDFVAFARTFGTEEGPAAIENGFSHDIFQAAQALRPPTRLPG